MFIGCCCFCSCLFPSTLVAIHFFIRFVIFFLRFVIRYECQSLLCFIYFLSAQCEVKIWMVVSVRLSLMKMYRFDKCSHRASLFQRPLLACTSSHSEALSKNVSQFRQPFNRSLCPIEKKTTTFDMLRH